MCLTLSFLQPKELYSINHKELSKCKLGLLVNFNVKLLKNGIKRVIL